MQLLLLLPLLLQLPGSEAHKLPQAGACPAPLSNTKLLHTAQFAVHAVPAAALQALLVGSTGPT
jgi:hypothetical protein